MDYLLNDPRLPDPDPEPKFPPPGPDPDEGDWNFDDPVIPPLEPMHARLNLQRRSSHQWPLLLQNSRKE